MIKGKVTNNEDENYFDNEKISDTDNINFLILPKCFISFFYAQLYILSDKYIDN